MWVWARSNSTPKVSSLGEGCLPIIYSIVVLSLAYVGFEFFSTHLLTPSTIGLGAWMTRWVAHLMELAFGIKSKPTF